MAEPSTISEPSAPPSADEGLMDDGGEGAAGNADAVWVKFADGSVDELDREVALLTPFIRELILFDGATATLDAPVELPKQVGPEVLPLVQEYLNFHRADGRSDKERKQFDERFIKPLDTRRLCELTSAADALGMKGLVDLTSRALARVIEGKTPEEIRETFNLPDDLTEEEKLEPVKAPTDDPRIRLLNRLYAKRRKELQDRKAPKEGTEGTEQPQSTDQRSLDELMNFIGGEQASKAKAKKKKSKKRSGGKAAGEGEVPGAVPEGPPSSSLTREGASPALDLFPEDGFDDDDSDPELDPELAAKLDQEVEEFARRLNADWRSNALPFGRAPAAGTPASPPPGHVDAAALAEGLQLSLARLLKGLGVSSLLQVNSTKAGKSGAPLKVSSLESDNKASVAVAGGLLTVRVCTTFTPGGVSNTSEC